MTFSNEKPSDDIEQFNTPEQPDTPETMKNDDFFDPEVAQDFNTQSQEKALMSKEIDTALERVDALDDNEPEEAMENDGIVQKLAEKLQKSKVAKYAVLGASLFFASPAAAAELGKDEIFRNSLSSQQNERIVSSTGRLTPGKLRLGGSHLERTRAQIGTGEVQPIQLNREYINRSRLHGIQNNLLNNPALRNQFQQQYKNPYEEQPGVYIDRRNSNVGSIQNDGGEVHIGTAFENGRPIE